MTRRVLEGIRSALEQLWGFLLLLFQMPTVRSGPDPSKAAARQVRRASHVTSAATFFTGTSATDEVLGKELAAGHKTTVYGDPMSERPLVSYDGRAPLHRRKPSRFVTALMVLLLAFILLGILRMGFFPLSVPW